MPTPRRRFSLPLSTAAALGLPVPLGACSVSRGVRPLGAGTTAVTASLGGPLVDYFGGYKPLPIGTLGLAHGVTDRLDLHGALNGTTLAMFGVVGGELGAGYLLLDQDGAVPALMGDLTVDLFAGDFADGAPEGGLGLFGEADLRASWAWGRREHLVYTGPTLFTQPLQAEVVPAWSLGNQLRLGRVDLITEARWAAPLTDNDALTVDYAGLGPAGGLFVQVGGRLRFGPGADHTGGAP